MYKLMKLPYEYDALVPSISAKTVDIHYNKHKKKYIIYKASRKIINDGGVKMKRTYQPNNRRKSKKIGFMARMKTKIVNRRRRKGRKVLSH